MLHYIGGTRIFEVDVVEGQRSRTKAPVICVQTTRPYNGNDDRDDDAGANDAYLRLSLLRMVL